MAEWTSLAVAVASNVRDGNTVAMEGFTRLIRFAAGHEVICQRQRRQTLVRMTPGLIYDQIIGIQRSALLSVQRATVVAEERVRSLEVLRDLSFHTVAALGVQGEAA